MKKVVLSATMLFVSVVGFSQTENSVTDKKLGFGFNLGVNYSNLQSKEPLPDNARISNGFGFNLGVLMAYQISKNFIFSPKIEMSLNETSVNFSLPDNSKTTYNIFPVSFDFMTHMIYKMGNRLWNWIRKQI